MLHRPHSYNKDYEPLFNLTGAMSSFSREKVLLCTQKRELESLSKYRGFGVYSMNKTVARMKMFITGQMRQVDWAAAQHLLSPFSRLCFGPPSKDREFGVYSMEKQGLGKLGQMRQFLQLLSAPSPSLPCFE